MCIFFFNFSFQFFSFSLLSRWFFRAFVIFTFAFYFLYCLLFWCCFLFVMNTFHISLVIYTSWKLERTNISVYPEWKKELRIEYYVGNSDIRVIIISVKAHLIKFIQDYHSTANGALWWYSLTYSLFLKRLLCFYLLNTILKRQKNGRTAFDALKSFEFITNCCFWPFSYSLIDQFWNLWALNMPIQS